MMYELLFCAAFPVGQLALMVVVGLAIGAYDRRKGGDSC